MQIFLLDLAVIIFLKIQQEIKIKMIEKKRNNKIIKSWLKEYLNYYLRLSFGVL